MAVALGGRVAEELIYGPDNVTTGASGDFQQVRTAWAFEAGNRLLASRCCCFCVWLQLVRALLRASNALHPTCHAPPPRLPVVQVSRVARMMVSQMGFSKKLGQVGLGFISCRPGSARRICCTT